VSKLWRRLLFLWHRDRLEAELREEMETHRRLREAALRDADDRAPAQHSTRLMGNATLAVEDARAVWLWPWLESLWLDVRHGLRALRRQPTFAVTALLTIAIGTGALTTAFAVAHTVLLKPPPFTNADRLVQVFQVREGRRRSSIASVDIDAFRTASTLSDVAFAYNSSVNLTGGELPETARAIHTDWHLFPVLGTPPVLGRWPTRTDEEGAAPPAVLSYLLWQRRYQGRPDVIGEPLDINGRRHTILAVMPEWFRFPSPYYVLGDLWIPRDKAHPTLLEPERALLLGFAAIKPGMTRAQAQAEIDVLSARLQSAHGETHRGVTFNLADWAVTTRQGSRQALILLVAAAAVVFLIVCINLFNLLLCRGLDRASEMATRASLGAGRARLARHLATETVVLFAVGGAAGLVLAAWLARAIAATASFAIERMAETRVDWQVAAASFALTCAAGLLVGMVPAIRTARGGITGTGVATRATTHHRRGRFMQRLLIASEIGLAVVLVCGAGAIATHASRFGVLDAGFEAARLVQARVSLPVATYPDAHAQSAFFEDVLTRLRAHPSIEAAGVSDLPPGVGGSATPAARLGGDPEPRSMKDLRTAAIRVVSDGYLETLGLQPVSGRLIRPSDKAMPLVAVVNETFARAYLDGAALGARVRVTIDGLPHLDTTDREIVGVVPDIKEDSLHLPSPPAVYIPMTQGQSLRVAMVVRAAEGANDVAPIIRAELAARGSGIAVSGLVMPLGELMESEFARTRLSLRLVGTLALIAVMLAIVGVYGVTAHGVQHRAREIGIRLALGSAPGAVRRMILAEGGVLLVAGVIAGGAGAVWALPLIKSLVVGVPQVAVLGQILGAALVLTLAVLAGCDVPARRAARVDPASALR
jgi:putative ABC transport system permease protein